MILTLICVAGKILNTIIKLFSAVVIRVGP